MINHQINYLKKILKSTSQNNVIDKKKNPIEEEIDEKTHKRKDGNYIKKLINLKFLIYFSA